LPGPPDITEEARPNQAEKPGIRSDNSEKLIINLYRSRCPPRRPVMTYRRDHGFSDSPPELWDVIGEVDRFEAWRPWLEEFRLGSLEKGPALRAQGDGSDVEVARTVEMMQRPMRLADRMAHPLLQSARPDRTRSAPFKSNSVAIPRSASSSESARAAWSIRSHRPIA